MSGLLPAAVLAVAAAAVAGWVSGRASTAGERRALRWRAGHDILTGLRNRAGLTEAAAAALPIGQPSVTGAALLLVDLDDFKAVNDVYGHAAGDAVLAQAAEELRRCAEDLGAVAARLGGDEFAVLLPAIGHHAGAAAAARAVHRALSRPYVVPTFTGRLPVGVGASVGAAVAAPGQHPSLGQLLCLADSAMYAAKRSRSGRALRSAGTGPATAGPGTAETLLLERLVAGDASYATERPAGTPTIRLTRRLFLIATPVAVVVEEIPLPDPPAHTPGGPSPPAAPLAQS